MYSISMIIKTLSVFFSIRRASFLLAAAAVSAFLVVVISPSSAHAAAPTIHSTSVGGQWSSPATWQENRIPAPSDEVEINGPVTLGANTVITGLAVSLGAVLSTTANQELTVNGSVINNGTIANYNNSQFILTIGGDIINNGEWVNYRTILFNTLPKQITGATPITSNFVKLNDDTQIVTSTIIDSPLDFNGHTLTIANPLTLKSIATTGTINGQGNLTLTGSIVADLVVNTPELTLAGSNVSINANIRAAKITFSEGSQQIRSVLTADEIIMEGTAPKILAGNATINGNVTISPEATLYSNWIGQTLTINGYLTNNGTITIWNNRRLVLQLKGNFTNNGSFNNCFGYVIWDEIPNAVDYEIRTGEDRNNLNHLALVVTNRYDIASTVNDTLYWQVRPRYGADVFGDWSETKWINGEDAPNLTPVILVPGITGTELEQDGETLWLNLIKMRDIGDDFLDALAMDSDGSPAEESVVTGDVLRFVGGDTFPLYDYFGGLIKELESRGYVEGENLFVFPYDWRRDISFTSLQLKHKIDGVIAQTGSPKVDVVAHSMGGLLAKKYVLDYPDHKIGKLVFIGTPHLGAPKALKTLMFGDNFDIRRILSALKIKEITHSMYSVYQLLPSTTYLNQLHGYFFDHSSNNSPPTALNYQDTKNMIIVNGYNSSAITSAENLHTTALDNIDLNNLGISDYNIAGCSTPSIRAIIKMNIHQNNHQYLLYMGNGDATVPLGSADAITAPAGHKFYFSGAEHGTMASQEPVRELVSFLLVDGEPGVGDLPLGIMTDTSACHISGKFVSVHSPVELHIYDSQGNHVGPGDNDAIEEDIPGVVYEVIDSDKFAWLPQGGEYSVRLVGTDAGSFDFRVASVADEQIIQTVLYDDVALIAPSRAEISITDDSDDTILSFDYDGDGQYQTIAASAVLDSSESLDLVFPTTQAQVSGTAEQNNWLRSSASISLTATDDNAGVLKTEYSLDNGITWLQYSAPLSLASDGIYTLYYRSVDRAGNIEPMQSVEIKIDTTPPEAEIWFDLTLKDLVVNGRDNLSTVTVVDTDETVTLTDTAGNTTELIFKERNRRRALSATLLNMRYNGVDSLEDLRNKLVFHWDYDRLGHLNRLVERVVVKKEFGVTVTYTHKSGVSKIIERCPGERAIKTEKAGLVLLKTLTNNGNLIYTY